MSMSLQDELIEFLKQHPQNIDDPPTTPPHLCLLSPQAYIDVALEYIEQYAFARTFIVFTLKTRAPSRFTPDCKWKIRAREYLQACIVVDRSGLASIDQAYDSRHQQQRFIQEVVFKQRFKLEELASEMIALVELVRSETKKASSVTTPLDTGNLREQSVKYKVRDRDHSCRMTGIARQKKNNPEQRARASLEVVHGLPYGMGATASNLVTALTGIPVNNWKVDCVENAFLTQASLHKLFGAFMLYLEWVDNQIFIRARTGAANPIYDLFSVVNDQRKICDEPGTLIDCPLRPRHDDNVPDIDQKFFVLHKFIGDIVWMCGGADESDDEEDEEAYVKVLSHNNFDEVVEMLNSSRMDFFS